MTDNKKHFSAERKIAKNVFKSKLKNRKRLAELPIEDKLRILIEMQKRAVAIAKSVGRDTSHMFVWKIRH